MKTKEKQDGKTKKNKLKAIIILISIILFIIICMIVFRNTNITFTTDENIEVLNLYSNIPDNAVEITDEEWIDIMSIEGQLLVIPITIIICLVIFVLSKKYPDENKIKIQEEMKKKKTVITQVLYGYKTLLILILKVMIMFIPMIIIHEFIHVFMMALFGDENIYVLFSNYAISPISVYSDIAKWQILLVQLMPTIFFIIMIIITVILYPKSNKKGLLMILLISWFMGLSSAEPDWIGAYNVIKLIPNGARFIETLESFYWYLPK